MGPDCIRRKALKGVLRGGVVGIPLMLAACANPFSDDAPTFSQLLSQGWLADDEAATPVEPLYCYVTIGVGDCHAAPVTGEGSRLLGYQGPMPQLKIEP